MANLKNNTASLQALISIAGSLPMENEYLDELNAANGGTAAVTMKTAVANTVTLASDQDELIEQLTQALSASPIAPPVLQSKIVTPSYEMQDIRPDSGYSGMSQVIVHPMDDNTIRVLSGTFTVNDEGQFGVQLGFRPDIIYITANEGYVGSVGEWQEYSTAACFSMTQNDHINCIMYGVDDIWEYPIYLSRNTVGFSGVIYQISMDYSYGVPTDMEFHYTAIKYT